MQLQAQALHLSRVPSRLTSWLCREATWSSFCRRAARSLSASPAVPGWARLGRLGPASNEASEPWSLRAVLSCLAPSALRC